MGDATASRSPRRGVADRQATKTGFVPWEVGVAGPAMGRPWRPLAALGGSWRYVPMLKAYRLI